MQGGHDLPRIAVCGEWWWGNGQERELAVFNKSSLEARDSLCKGLCFFSRGWDPLQVTATALFLMLWKKPHNQLAGDGIGLSVMQGVCCTYTEERDFTHCTADEGNLLPFLQAEVGGL